MIFPTSAEMYLFNHKMRKIIFKLGFVVVMVLPLVLSIELGRIYEIKCDNKGLLTTGERVLSKINLANINASIISQSYSLEEDCSSSI